MKLEMGQITPGLHCIPNSEVQNEVFCEKNELVSQNDDQLHNIWSRFFTATFKFVNYFLAGTLQLYLNIICRAKRAIASVMHDPPLLVIK